MMYGFGWAKYPMINRVDKLSDEVPITLLYGSRSWIDHSASEIIQDKRINSYVKIQVGFQLNSALCIELFLFSICF